MANIKEQKIQSSNQACYFNHRHFHFSIKTMQDDLVRYSFLKFLTVLYLLHFYVIVNLKENCPHKIFAYIQFSHRILKL